jgi:Repeat of unknown function (DUF5907)
MIATSSGKPIIATDRLLGRSTSGTGPAEEISLGTGLSLTGGTLNASAQTTIGTSAADVLSIAAGEITADDPGADRLLFWDDSESKLTHLTLGTALSISGTTLNAETGTQNYTTNNTTVASSTLARFTAAKDNQPPATGFGTLDTRNSIAVLDFDAATVESAIFSSVIPEAADLTSGLLVRLLWMATSATSGNCRWGVQVERANTDLDSDSYDTAAEAHTAAPATSGIPTLTEITLTTIDGLTAGDTYRLKVFRKADDATNDTMTGDAELIAVEIRSAA